MRTKVYSITLIFLLMFVSTLAFDVRLVNAKTVTVPDDYTTIQKAVNVAKSGDTVFVKKGTYYENVVVNKTVSLLGESPENTIIDGGALDNTITVKANNVVIKNFTVTHSNGSYPNSGIFLDTVNNTKILYNNVAFNNGHGIFVMWGYNNNVSYNLVTNNTQPGIRVDGTTSRAVVTNNTVRYNQGDGIFLYSAYNVRVENNTVTDNVRSGITVQGGSLNVTIRRNWVAGNGNYGTGASTWYYGIQAYDSNGTSITENNITMNKCYGLYIYSANNTSAVGNTFANDGMVVRESYGNTVKNNIVNGKPLVYFESVSGRTVSNAGQVVLVNCTNIKVQNLNLSNADVGVVLFLTNSCNVTGNTMANGYVGMRLYNSSRNVISGNKITTNSFHGIYASYSCCNNTLSGNTITKNDWMGIQLGLSSSNNTISGNSITVNGQNGINIYTYSSNNTVSGNNVTTNGATGLSVGTFSDSNNISGNKFSGNGLDGVTLYDSSHTTVSGNNIMNNDYGVELQSANYSKIFHNNFINNTINQEYADTNSFNNVWDNGYPSAGNYWSDYTSKDSFGGAYQNKTGSDGIGDTLYSINETGIDTYPLMLPWGSITGLTVLPSPFNTTKVQTTNINYTLFEDCKVTIKIFDNAGKLVKTLSNNAIQNAGTHSVVWDGTNSTGNTVPPGTYTTKIYVTDKAGNRAIPYPATKPVKVVQ